MKKVLITGGAGFIGSHVAESFLENGYEVSVIDNLVTGKFENIKNKNLRFYDTDIRDKEKLDMVFSREMPNYVVHLAAQVSVSSSVKDVTYDAEENITGLINLLEACKKYEIKKIVFSSTAAVYGIPEEFPSKEENTAAPLSPYGLSKLTGEEYIKMYEKLFGLEYIILRYANVYGPRQSAHGEAGVVSIFNDRMQEDREIFIDGDGMQTRDFVYVKDVSAANYKCTVEDIKNMTFNVSTNTDIEVRELFDIMKKYSGYAKEPVHKEAREGDIRNSKLDNKKLIDNTSWKPEYNLEKGLKEYLSK